MKFYIKEEMGSVYYIEDEVIMVCPINEDNTFNTLEGYALDTDQFPDIYQEVLMKL